MVEETPGANNNVTGQNEKEEKKENEIKRVYTQEEAEAIERVCITFGILQHSIICRVAK